jgi:cell division protein FtsL
MAEHCKPNHERREPSTVNCIDHSGIEMWMRGVGAMVACCVSLLAYSVFWQAPNIRADIAREIARLDKQDAATTYENQNIKRDVADINRRVSILEGKE